MLCFQVRERVTQGILLCRKPTPHIPQRGLPITPLLGESLVRAVQKETRAGEFYLEETSLIQVPSGLVFQERSLRRDNQRKALVRIETAAGIKGSIFLTTSMHKEVRSSRQEVAKEFLPLPAPGVHFFCAREKEAELHRQLTEGTDCLDVLVAMEPGASLRIKRTGDLRDSAKCPWDASPQLFLHWRGEELLLKPTSPHRYQRTGVVSSL